jgi:hypothetical protein
MGVPDFRGRAGSRAVALRIVDPCFRMDERRAVDIFAAPVVRPLGVLALDAELEQQLVLIVSV